MATKRRKRRYAVPIGGIFILLALLGLIGIVWGSISLTGRVLDNSREKQQMEDIIRPVLMFDPVPFERVSDIEPTRLLYYSMWAALTDENASYGYGASGEEQDMVVPASDLDVAAAKLFGPDTTLEHRTFGEYDSTYYLDQEKQLYHVPLSAQMYVYTPRVEEIVKSGELYEVRVGYIPPDSPWNDVIQGKQAETQPDKYMIYVMRKVGDTYQIVAVRDDAGSQGETHMVAQGGAA